MFLSNRELFATTEQKQGCKGTAYISHQKKPYRSGTLHSQGKTLELC